MKNDLPLAETNIAGRNSRERFVRGNAADKRDWLAHAPVCEALARRHIAHAGVAEAVHPYRVVRRDLSGTSAMACCKGEGRVWLDGRWQSFCGGQACVAPPHVVHAYCAVPGKPWEFVWVRYQEPAGQRPIASASSPLLTTFDGEALRDAVLGLLHEAGGAANHSAMDLWVEIVEHYVRQFTQPRRRDDRLDRLWEAVAEDLSADWSVEKLARRVGLSAQQLRRLCQQQLGRKPVAQLAWLRIRQAATMIASGNDKIETVAHAVGYRSAFTFSSTFRRITGCRPSEYRAG